MGLGSDVKFRKSSQFVQTALEEQILLTLLLPETKIAEFVNSINLNEVAHNEPSHLDLHCLPSSI